MKIAILFFLVIIFTNTTSWSQSSYKSANHKFVKEFDAYTKEVLKNTDIPAIGITIHNGLKPIFMKTYGYANKEKKIKADNNTLFYIASSTKSFTALAAAELDGESIIKLDDPIEKFMKTHAFKNSIPIDRITMKHLLTHTSGLENDALVFRSAYSGISEEKELLHLLKEETLFNDTLINKYNYDNLGYNIYALLLQVNLQQNWKDVLATKIFKPLKMKRSTCYMSEAIEKGWTVASPYLAIGHNGALKTNLPKQDNNLQSAGGIFSSTNDLSRWLEFNMNNGKINDKQIFEKNIIEKCHTGYVSFERTVRPFTGLSQYGLGWIIGRYKNERIIYHFGGFAGYSAHISFMPDKKIGVAITTNESAMGSRVAALLATYAYDWWLQQQGIDTIYERKKNELKLFYENRKATSAKDLETRSNLPSKLSLPIQEYTGEYQNEFLGNMIIYINDSMLCASLGNMNSSSTYYTENETIRVELIPGNGEIIQFIKADNQSINKLAYNNYTFNKK